MVEKWVKDPIPKKWLERSGKWLGLGKVDMVLWFMAWEEEKRRSTFFCSPRPYLVLAKLGIQAIACQALFLLTSSLLFKSTLLSTILKETCLSSGTVHVEGSIAYTAQSPSLFPATVRENILFGKPMEFEWYSKVVEACALDHDFRLLPFGDETVVADKGVTLSGGQKARISLAR